MKILGIETSCDETSAAVVCDGRKVLSNVIYSQIDIHKAYGGVVPEIASRNHIKKIDVVVRQALAEANLGLDEIDAIAVTASPGLVGALLVGVNFAKALAYGAGIKLVAVNHIYGHIASNYLETELEPPFVSLVVSGGHTSLYKVADYGDFELLGQTFDDAAGEAFDKVARVLNLPYPGGVHIENLAQNGNKNAINFPVPFQNDEQNLNFSYSGLKSAVLNYINKAKMANQDISKSDLAASFQRAAISQLVLKSIIACKTHNISTLAISGGVACNKSLRQALEAKCQENHIQLLCPKPIYCTDNAAMIASQGYFDFRAGKIADLRLNASPTGAQ